MDEKELLKRVDHTLLRPDATWAEIKQLCDEGARYGVASVCIPPAFVRPAAEYLAGALPVCTVIGFPNGYATTKTKCFEAADAIENGAAEIDMVIALGAVKAGDYDAVLAEIRAVRAACGEKVLKVIIETCCLSREEKIVLCGVVSDSGADYIKTSTGFGGGGATFDDVALLREHIRPGLKIKAAGGIKTLADAEQFVALGADRLGTSRVVAAIRAAQEKK